MEITVKAGQTVCITIEVIEAPRAKPGPKSLMKSVTKPEQYFYHILENLKNGPMTANELRQAIDVMSSDNAFSWALVMLQNEGSKRGRNIPKTGLIIKLDDSRYALRNS